MRQFLLENDSAYRTWRMQKLRHYPQQVERLVVNITNPYELTVEERNSLLQICQKTNMVFYKIANCDMQDKNIVSAITKQLGLEHLDANLCADRDSISSIQVISEGLNSTYIPYTNKSLNWHTDGYYNQDQQRIRAFLMHCARPASLGGENSYLDPEIAYILLRDKNPGYIAALMDPAVMTIPANEETGKEIRAAQTGPVFLIDEVSQSLYMRYTARQRNIMWKNDETVQSARSFLQEILQSNPHLFRYRLRTGEGIICNNVLHNRTAFKDSVCDDEKRLLYRARFYNRLAKYHVKQDSKVVVNKCYG